jgi:hypothetical protein
MKDKQPINHEQCEVSVEYQLLDQKVEQILEKIRQRKYKKIS